MNQREQSARVQDLRIGTVVGQATVRSVVHRGRLATVYRGEIGDHDVAIKIYRVTPLHSAQRIDRERIAQQQVDHPCVARLVEWGTLTDGAMFLTSQWIDGVPFNQRLEQGPIAWEDLRPIARDVSKGLMALHAAGIIHRDIKPSNIVLPNAAHETAVLLDLGHALLLDQERLTGTGLVLGSATYMAPEQTGGKTVDERADLYSLGVVLYEALTGSPPFVANSPARVMRLHQTEAVESPRLRAIDLPIPQAADDLCMWLLAKSPAARLPSARVLTIALTSIDQPEEKVA